MARIIKIRVIPRGYVPLDDEKLISEIEDYVRGKSIADFFMVLYNKLGNPQEEGIFSYLIRQGWVVLKITATDREHITYKLWVSPQMMLDARRKRIKVMNVIARRLNEEDVPFMLGGEVPEGLYFAVRQKNDRLLGRKSWTQQEIDDAMTDGERYALYAGVAQYTDAKSRVFNLLDDLFV